MNWKRNRAKAIFARWLTKQGYGTVKTKLTRWIIAPSSEDTFIFIAKDLEDGSFVLIGKEVESIPRNQAIKLLTPM